MTVREMTIAETAELLREKDDILIVCHAHPDGDAVGCGVALERMLTSLGKTAYLICADVLPHHLRFLLGYRPSDRVDTDAGALRRNEGAKLRHERNERRLTHVGRFARHVGAGDDGDAVRCVV